MNWLPCPMTNVHLICSFITNNYGLNICLFGEITCGKQVSKHVGSNLWCSKPVISGQLEWQIQKQQCKTAQNAYVVRLTLEQPSKMIRDHNPFLLFPITTSDKYSAHERIHIMHMKNHEYYTANKVIYFREYVCGWEHHASNRVCAGICNIFLITLTLLHTTCFEYFQIMVVEHDKKKDFVQRWCHTITWWFTFILCDVVFGMVFHFHGCFGLWFKVLCWQWSSVSCLGSIAIQN